MRKRIKNNFNLPLGVQKIKIMTYAVIYSKESGYYYNIFTEYELQALPYVFMGSEEDCKKFINNAKN